MFLWRISNYTTLDGAGGLLTAGRWHSRGRPIVYCALNPATALLEVLVHMEIDAEDRPENFQLLKIRCPVALAIKKVDMAALPANWTKDVATTRAIGDDWLGSGTSPLLEVPSVLVPETSNILINPSHRQANRLTVVHVYRHPFDQRLIE